MRYYIEAFDDKGQQILGNLDGQRALGDMRQPLRSKAWRVIVENKIPAMRRVVRWHLVNENGAIIDRAYRSHWLDQTAK